MQRQWTSGISEVSLFYYGNKIFIVYLRSLFCTEALAIVAQAAKLRRDFFALILAMAAAED